MSGCASTAHPHWVLQVYVLSRSGQFFGSHSYYNIFAPFAPSAPLRDLSQAYNYPMTHPQPQIDTLLARPVLARIATANPTTLQPHVVPVWFWWDGAALWISAFDSTRKIRDLRRNPRISVLIEDPDLPEGKLQALLFEGPVELVKDPETVARVSNIIYTRYMGEEGVLAADPQSWIVDPENTLIKLVPAKTFSW